MASSGNTGNLGDGGAEAALFAAHPYGQHIDGGIIAHAVVGVAVHVDGDVRDDGAGVLEIHELHRKLVALGDENTARHGKRPVEPRGAEHPAVFLHGETEIIPVRKLRVLLDLERRLSPCAAVIIKPAISPAGTRNAISEEPFRVTKYLPPGTISQRCASQSSVYPDSRSMSALWAQVWNAVGHTAI